jgi:fructose-bisphosphate aldolase class I
MEIEKLQQMAQKLLTPGKGILAADQSPRTMNRQLASIGVPEEAEMRRQYRQLLFTTAGIEQHVTGVILHDGTIRNQTDDGTPFVDLLVGRGIVPIIKVDKSTVPLDGFPGEVVTEGLDGLATRLAEYYEMGARATKWRAVITIGDNLPTEEAIKLNALLLARYARLAQEAGLVPIVEPEVIFAGNHDLATAEAVTTLTLQIVFTVLQQYRVDLSGMILKSSMVLAGSEHSEQTDPATVAEATVRTLVTAVPEAVPGVVFLSGGQTPERATQNLNAIAAEEQKRGGLPWELAFSFSRGIEEPVQQTWRGDAAKVGEAQSVLRDTLARNAAADRGEL